MPFSHEGAAEGSAFRLMAGSMNENRDAPEDQPPQEAERPTRPILVINGAGSRLLGFRADHRPDPERSPSIAGHRLTPASAGHASGRTGGYRQDPFRAAARSRARRANGVHLWRSSLRPRHHHRPEHHMAGRKNRACRRSPFSIYPSPHRSS